MASSTVAFESLASTHFYGRHLVLEWADEKTETVEAVREKTKRQFSQTGSTSNKRAKIDMDSFSLSKAAEDGDNDNDMDME